MKNFYLLLVLICLGCGRKSLPVSDGWAFPVGKGDFVNNPVKGYSTDSVGRLEVETFRLGKGDTLFRKVVIDSSWVEIK